MTAPTDLALLKLAAEAVPDAFTEGLDQLPVAEDELIDLQGPGVRVTVICGLCQGKGCEHCQDGEVEFPGDGYDIVWGP